MKTIKTLRTAKGWSQVELAYRVGVSPSSIYNWERGRYAPRFSQLQDLAKALGVRLDDITLTTENETKKVLATAV